MSIYIDKINTHSIHTKLESVKNELNFIKELPDKSPDAVETIARISMVVKNFTLSLISCDRNYIAYSWLEESNKALTNLENYLRNYKSNKDTNSLINNCTNPIDIILTTTAKFNCIIQEGSLPNKFDAEKEYFYFMDSQNRHLHEKVNALEHKISELNNQIDQQNKEAKKNLQTLQNSIETEKTRLDGFATSYQNQMTEDKKASMALNDKQTQDFNSAQNNRDISFSEQMNIFKKQESEINQTTNEKIDELEKNNDKLIKTFEEKFLNYEQQVKDIVGIVNTNMFSHKYKEVADDAKKRARRWHILTIVLMLIVGGFAVYAFMLTVNDNTNWVKLIAKIFATTTLVTSAAYSARQASKQEKVERFARKIEMELVALDPFIESIEEEKRSLIKEEIARKLFGNANTMDITNNDEGYTALDKLSSIEQTLLDIFKKIK